MLSQTSQVTHGNRLTNSTLKVPVNLSNVQQDSHDHAELFDDSSNFIRERSLCCTVMIIVVIDGILKTVTCRFLTRIQHVL